MNYEKAVIRNIQKLIDLLTLTRLYAGLENQMFYSCKNCTIHKYIPFKGKKVY